MDEILAPIKQRILLVLDYKEIKKLDFFKKLGVAASNFRGKSLQSEVGGDVIVKILTHFPDVSSEWLLLGKGSMIKSNKSLNTVPSDVNSEKDERIKELKEMISLQKDRIKDLEERINDELAQRGGGGSMDAAGDAECAAVG